MFYYYDGSNGNINKFFILSSPNNHQPINKLPIQYQNIVRDMINDICTVSKNKCGVDMDFYTLRPRELDELLPWDFIDAGVTKEFLKREWQRACEGTVTPNCRMSCSGCGARKYGGGVCFEDQN